MIPGRRNAAGLRGRAHHLPPLRRFPGRLLLACLAAATTAAAQSAIVSTLADSGPGSLRAALTAANASAAATFTIDVAATSTAGPILLATMLPQLTKSNVTIRAASGAGRLVVDARVPSASTGYGLNLAGTNVQVLAPCRVLVQQGNGVVVSGAQTRFADLETIGSVGGNGLVALAGANDLVLGRFLADGFQVGLHLQDCLRAHVADDGVSTVEARNCVSPGIRVTNGSSHTIGSFVCTANETGLMAVNSAGLRLGSAIGPRSRATGNRRQGILLSQCSGASLADADLLDNGTPLVGPGLQVVGGTGVTVRDVRAERNAAGGLLFEGGVANLRVGPNVSTRGVLAAADVGITVRGSSAVTIVDCTFGPDHRTGALLTTDGGIPTNVTFCRCAIGGNAGAGLSASRCANVLVCSSVLAGNTGDGIEALGATLAAGPRAIVIADCIVSGNAGSGVNAHNADGLQVGPGNLIDDNLYGGVDAHACASVVVRDCESIDRNRAGGIWFIDCYDPVVARSAVRANRGHGIYALRCSALAVGPGVDLRDTIGTGVLLVGSSGCRVFSSQITASTSHGFHVMSVPGAPGSAPHVLQSCLLADHPGLALFHEGGPPVSCELCTIAGNLRGVDSGANPMTIDSCIVWANVLQDLQTAGTGLSVRNTFYQVPAPAPGTTNTNADPLFVSAATRDWRLQPASPALGYANPAIAVAPGALDAFGGPRIVGALDAGAYEVGSHAAPSAGRLLLASATMANGGGGLAFQVQYPPTTAGLSSILLMELGAPSGSFPAFGAVIPLAQTPALLLAANDLESVGTTATIGPDGLCAGALLWAGRIPAGIRNQVVSLCAVAFDATPMVRSVSNVASFTIL